MIDFLLWSWLTFPFYIGALWSAFYLLNYADITQPLGMWLKNLFGPKLGYPLGCAFCWGFWVTLALWLGTNLVFGVWIWIAPLTNLFVDLTYRKLSDWKEPV